MAGRIARLLGKKEERPDVAAAAAQLARLAEERPDLAEAAAAQAALLRAIYAAPAPVAPVDLSAEQAAAKLDGGVPLLRNLPLPLADGDLRAAFERLCRAAEGAAREGQDRQRSAATLAAIGALRRSLDVYALGGALLRGEGEELPARLEAAGLAPDLGLLLLRLALLPFFEQVAAQLAPLRAGRPWRAGICPTCGAWPLLAEQRGLEQFRYLRCGLCATSWQSDRVRCAFCGNREYTSLGYLQVEGEEQRERAATCDECHRYLKIRSTLTPLTTPQLLVAEVALVHLDVIALERGYVS